MLDLKRSVSAARPLLSSGNLIYALIILGRLNPAVSGRYTAGGWQEEEEEEREGVTETESQKERAEWLGRLSWRQKVTVNHHSKTPNGLIQLWFHMIVTSDQQHRNYGGPEKTVSPRVFFKSRRNCKLPQITHPSTKNTTDRKKDPISKCLKPALLLTDTRWQCLWLESDFWSYWLCAR